MESETISLDGHIIDSLTLSKVLDIIVREGGEYRIRRFDVGSTRSDTSHAEIEVNAPSETDLEHILHLIQQHGAARRTGEVLLSPAPRDGVFPEGFYSTTNLNTWVTTAGKRFQVPYIEMDCAIVVTADHSQAQCVPMHQVRAGDLVVVGDAGVTVAPMKREDPSDAFYFMGSTVSTERPKELVIAAIADAIRTARELSQRVLLVGGPAILHTGAGGHLESIIKGGWIDVLFAGNALATHDIEGALFGTSLGIDTSTGVAVAHGHEHHLRAINTIRLFGGIQAAIDAGILKSGIMHAAYTRRLDVVLAGSIRDDGPLPDVITDTMKAQDAMRVAVRGVTVAMMVATTLHAVATGNMLSAYVQTVCVDSDPDTVIKLMDRGSHQALGLVTDCEFFLKRAFRAIELRPWLEICRNVDGGVRPDTGTAYMKTDADYTRLLMCAPDHYGIDYEINPWMHRDRQPDNVKSASQWRRLYHILTETVQCKVELVPQPVNCPDMVFTANAGLAVGDTVLLSRFRHPQRGMEEPLFKEWFHKHGYKVLSAPRGIRFEGEGDALIAGDCVLAGYLKRSDIASHAWISETLQKPVISLGLTDSRWYHLDTCLFVPESDLVVYFPGAFDEYACRVLKARFETIEVEESEALSFACNSIVVNEHIVMPSGCPLLVRQLSDRGYHIHVVEMSEFMKAGGAAKCLVLLLHGAAVLGLPAASPASRALSSIGPN